MKKIISLFITLVLVFSVFSALTINVSAVPTDIGINGINTGFQEGRTVIFTPDKGATLKDAIGNECPWWVAVAFQKDGDGYKVVETRLTVAQDALKGDLAIPENGFIVASNTGNNYPVLHEQNPDGGFGGKPNYVTTFNSTAYNAIKLLEVGDVLYLNGINLAAGTIDDNLTEELLWYMEGYVSNAKLSVEKPATVEESEEPSVEPSEEPTAETSDVGYIAIAIISMIALAGAIVVKKVR